MKNFLALLSTVHTDFDKALDIVIAAGPLVAGVGGPVGAEVVAVATAVKALDEKLTGVLAPKAS